jgi:general secretion pathway protein G
MKKAFTMLELIFVIVVLSILASVALPKLWVTRDDALFTKAKTQIATIRAGISSAYSQNIMSGEMDKCPELEKDSGDEYVFENVINPPIKRDAKDISWDIDSDDSDKTTYKLKIGEKETTFTYEKNASKNCPFTCNSSDELCKELNNE